MVSFRFLGWIGLVNLSVLLLITIYKTVRYIRLQKSTDSITVRKRILLHILLLFAVAVDIPMYISFVMIDYYGMVTYSFHKLEPAFLLGAYSMTISDWGSVLYDIQEMKHTPLIFRRGALIFINVLFSAVCISNFIYVNLSVDLDKFTKSPLYIAMIVLQIATELFLTLMMLSAGLRLSRRIRGVSGMLNTTTSSSSLHSTLLGARNQPVTCTAAGQGGNGSHQSSVVRYGGSMGFESALNKLIAVMATCVCCISVQLLLLFLNYVLGYERDAEKSVGPELFYWTFYAWIPIWGPTLALLYLTRARPQKDPGDATTSVQHTPRPTDWSGSGFGSGRYSALAAKGSPEKGDSGVNTIACLTPDALREGSLDPPSSDTSQQRRGTGTANSVGGNSAATYSYSVSPSVASITPSPSATRPGLIYRPPDYPSVLFNHPKDGHSDDGGSNGDDSEFVSERTTSVSLAEGGIGGTTPTSSFREDEEGQGGEVSNWMYPSSEVSSSVDDLGEDTPPSSIFASNLSASHNMLTRISSIGTGGSFNDDAGAVVAAAVRAQKRAAVANDSQRNKGRK